MALAPRPECSPERRRNFPERIGAGLVARSGHTHFSNRGWSSSPGEFHPEALTEPCVNLSIHTALHS